ncbi:MAG: ChaN family lipoprotein, partial [Alloprevotella sp.]|nr:ChaN family lipoprotein [Alloprevotella sp.]
MRKLLFLLNFLFIASAYAQQPQAYALFDHSGKLTFYAAMMDSLSRADVVFFGEMHNCPITHWMEQNVLQTLVDRFGKEVMVGAEMFESDNQLILDEYLQRRISGERFEAECRLWPN